MTATLLVKKVACFFHPCCFFRKRMVAVSFISFEKFELRMKKKCPHFFPSRFEQKKV